MWVNTVTPNQTLLSQWESRVAGRFAWFIQGDGTVKMITNVAPFDATVQPSSLTAVTDGQWHHIACTYDYDATTSTGVLKMYVDGILEDTTDPLGFSTSATGRIVQIGAEQQAQPIGFAPFYQGQLDEIRLWDVARTQAEIQANMTAVDPTSTNLLRSYSFNGSDSQIIDASGNGSPIVINNSNIAQESIGIRVNLTVTDNNGNTASAPAFVKITDDIAPVITLSGDATITLPLNETYSEQGATATDNCSIDVNGVVVAGDVVDTTIAGTYSVTYNVMDTSGNPATQLTRTVQVVELPTVITKNITAILDATGNATITPSQINDGSLDSGGNAITNLSLDKTTFDCDDVIGAGDTNRSLLLDGSNDHITTRIDADVLAMPQTTWEGWVKPEVVATGFEMLFSVDDGGWDRFLTFSNNELRLSDGDSAEVITTYDAGEWMHVAVTYNQTDNEAFAYVNGVQYGPYTTVFGTKDNTETFLLSVLIWVVLQTFLM